MKHKVKVTVIDKKFYPDLQQQYCTDPNAGMCPCYSIGDEFVFYRDDINDHFWHGGLNTLVKTTADHATVAGGPEIPTAPRRGTPFQDISTPACKAALS